MNAHCGRAAYRLRPARRRANALLLAIMPTFLFLLARRLPPAYRLRGVYAVVVALVIAATVIFGVYSGLAGL